MTNACIAIVGGIGPLARATSDALNRRGHQVITIDMQQRLEAFDLRQPSRMLLLPFSRSMSRRALRKKSAELDFLRSVVHAACCAGISRLVLRSHAIAYGASMKNPGLMDEGRPTLLPKDSVERRWLEAEQIILEANRSAAEAQASDSRSPGSTPPLFSTAIVRLAPILEPREGDLIAQMLKRTITVPLAGYDPQLQLFSLLDAAECLALAVLSDTAGIINGSPHGTVPVKAALKAAVPWRIQVNGVLQKPVRSFFWKLGLAEFPGEALDRIKYNLTISNERAQHELNFQPGQTSTQALKQYLSGLPHAKPSKIKEEYDEFGLDPAYLRRWNWWFNFLRKVYWRAEAEGLENLPAEGPALIVANHRGFMPFDGVIHRSLILEATNRHIRFLVIPSLFKFPFLSDFLIKQGGVVASQTNTRKLFLRKDLVGFFPEGINGAFRVYRGAYRLGEMGKNAFAKMAIENGVPIIPAVVIGHVEIFPILFKVRSSLVVRHTGWPFLPITPTFPLLPVPLPTKWHIRYMEAIPVDAYSPSDAANPQAVRELAAAVVKVMQSNIDDMLRRRKHLFFGNIFEARGRGVSHKIQGAIQ